MNRVCVKKAAQFQSAAGPKIVTYSHLHIIHGLENYGQCSMDYGMFYDFYS